jgi:anti-sigma B factor antagonist
MATALELSHCHDPNGTAIVAARGEIDMSNAGSLRDALRHAAPNGDLLIVDLSAVEYLDSAGLTALLDYLPGLRLIANPLIEPILTMSGLGAITTVGGDSRLPRRAARR